MWPKSVVVPFIEVRFGVHEGLLFLAVVTSVALGSWGAWRLEGVSVRRTTQAILVMATGALLGGRLHFVMANWDLYAATPLMALKFWTSIHAAGAVIGAVAGACVATRWFTIPMARVGDAMVPGAGLGIAIARLGCFLHGCCFGAVCSFPWCMRFPALSGPQRFHASQGLIPDMAPASLPVHPLQLYFAGVGILLTLGSLAAYRYKRFDGQVGLTALALFSLTSATLETLRTDWAERPYWGPLPQLLWIALAMTIVFGTLLVIAANGHRESPAALRDGTG